VCVSGEWCAFSTTCGEFSLEMFVAKVSDLVVFLGCWAPLLWVFCVDVLVRHVVVV
jgi:hypothetical protein